MEEKQMRSPTLAVMVGDVIALALVTAYGFYSHGTLGSAGSRMLATFVPLLAAWFAIAPLLGVYRPPNLRKPVDLWRPFLAMVIATPLAAWIRAAMLQSTVQPLFVLILGGVSVVVVLAWRLLYFFWLSRQVTG